MDFRYSLLVLNHGLKSMSDTILIALIGLAGTVMTIAGTLFSVIVTARINIITQSQVLPGTPIYQAAESYLQRVRTTAIVIVLGGVGLIVFAFLISREPSTASNSRNLVPDTPTQTTNSRNLVPDAPTQTTLNFNTPVPSKPVYSSEYTLLSLENFIQARGANLGLNPGQPSVLNIPFDFQGTVSTQSQEFNNYPTQIPLVTNIANPTKVHLLIQAGWAFNRYSEETIGRITLNFADGQQNVTPLVLGENIRDWTRTDTNAVSSFTSKNLQPAIEATVSANDPRLGGIDVLTIPIPEQYHSSILNKIVVEDTSGITAGSMDPCIHLLGVTVEWLNKH